MVEAPCLRVPARLGERAMLFVRGLELLDSQLTVEKNGDYVVIPLSRRLSAEEVAALKEQIREVDITVDRFDERKRRAQTLHDALKDRIPPQLLGRLPRSMDLVGRVAIVEIPPELKGYERLVGEAVMEVNRNVKTVLVKAGAVCGEYRLREFEVIAGTGETETVYREHGCVYHLDPTKVYFSPRLSQERWRIVQKVRSGEVVVDMFAGVGPFSIQTARKRRDVEVYAIDSNPDAIHFLEKNIAENKVNNVFPLLGDAREVVERSLAGKADRVIMNLPERAIEFVDVACKALKPSGGIIHYYGFEAEPDALKKGEEKLEKAVSSAGRTVRRVLDSRLVKPTAPHEWQVAVDALVS